MAPGPLPASGRRCPFPPRPAFPGHCLPQLPQFSDPLQAWLNLGPLSPSPTPASHFKALPRKKLVCLPGRLSSLGKSPTFLLLDRCRFCHQPLSFLESETPRKNDPFSQVGPGVGHSRNEASGLPRAPRRLCGGRPSPWLPRRALRKICVVHGTLGEGDSSCNGRKAPRAIGRVGKEQTKTGCASAGTGAWPHVQPLPPAGTEPHPALVILWTQLPGTTCPERQGHTAKVPSHSSQRPVAGE